MATATTQWREPAEFAAGDSLIFERCLSDYPAPVWSIDYEMRGGAQAINWTTVADGSNHFTNIAKATTAAWLPGDYTLAGYVGNGTERHQIYQGPCTILPNVPLEAGNEPQQTFAQTMLANLEAVMLGKAGADLLESRIGETQFKYMSQADLRTEHGYWSMVRKNEIAKENARMGRPTGNNIRPVMRVKQGSFTVGAFTRPWPY